MGAGDVSVSGARMTGLGITLTASDGSTTEYAKNATGAYVGPAGDARGFVSTRCRARSKSMMTPGSPTGS